MDINSQMKLHMANLIKTAYAFKSIWQPIINHPRSVVHLPEKARLNPALWYQLNLKYNGLLYYTLFQIPLHLQTMDQAHLGRPQIQGQNP